MAASYAALIQRYGKWWIGWVEEIPGVNPQGRTREELLENLRDALEEALEMNRAEELSQGGRVINREQAEERLLAIADSQLAALATRFANRVIASSEAADAPQDLSYFVELFLRAVQDKRVIEGIVSGSISRHSRQLTDPDFW